MVSDVYFPRVNGVSTSIQTFRQELTRQGHKVTLIAPDYGQVTDDERAIVRIPAWPVIGDPEDRLMRFKAILAGLDDYRRQQFDIVHIQTPFVAHYAGVRLAQALRVPRVATYHTLLEQYLAHYIQFVPKRWLESLARWFSRRQGNDLNGLVVPSRTIHDLLRDYGVHTAMRIIPTGIDLPPGQTDARTTFRKRYNIAPQRPMLVYVGRVAFEKNIDFLLHVVQALKPYYPDLLLIIVGEGPAQRHLQRLGRRLDIADNLLFVGYLPRHNGLAACYQAGDVFVFSSSTETQGLVLLEAMGLGLPVVATAVMGTRDVLKDGQGVLIAPEKVPEFAAKVRRLLDDAELRRCLGARGQVYARQWQAEAPARALVEFYRSLIEKTEPSLAEAS